MFERKIVVFVAVVFVAVRGERNGEFVYKFFHSTFLSTFYSIFWRIKKVGSGGKIFSHVFCLSYFPSPTKQ